MQRHYFPHATSHPFRFSRFSLKHVPTIPNIAIHRIFVDVAVSLVAIFMPIFWFHTFGSSFAFTMLFYAGEFFCKLPFYVPVAKIFSKIGLKMSMFIGVLAYVGFFVISYIFNQGNYSSFPWMVVMLLVILTTLSTFYWAPFHIDMAMSLKNNQIGTQIGIIRSFQHVFLVLAPLVGGFIISYYGYGAAFIIGILLLFCSIIPLIHIPRFVVNYEFGFLQTIKMLFSKKYRSMSLSMMAYGAENMIGAVVWPIFLYMLFKGNYLQVGGFATFFILVSLILELFVGKMTDVLSPKKMLHIGSGIYALGWVWKGFVQTISGVFAASTFHTFGAIVLRTPVDALSYHQAADAGHYIDEYTIIREMALCMGRVIMLLIVVVFTSFFSLSVSFFLAAVVSLGINYLTMYSNSQK